VNAGGELVFVCGRDPYSDVGGSESFEIAVARAAVEMGLRPHVFAVGPRTEVREEAEATVHVVRTPVRTARNYVAFVHHPLLRSAVVRFLAQRPGPHVVHGFASWNGSAASAVGALRRRGVEVASVATVWTTIEHETAAKLGSEVVQASRRLLLEHRCELLVTRVISRRYERRAFHAADVLLVNYESVRALLTAAYGPGLPIRRTTYAAAVAYAPQPDAGAPLPVGLDALADPAPHSS